MVQLLWNDESWIKIRGCKINVSDTPIPGSIEYSSHVRSIGWQNYVRDDAISEQLIVNFEQKRIRIRLTGQLAEHYDVYYRVHSAYFGWLGWTKIMAMQEVQDLVIRWKRWK